MVLDSKRVLKKFFGTQRASQIIVSLASFEDEKKTVIFKTKGDKQIFN